MGNHMCGCCIRPETPKISCKNKQLLGSIIENEDKQMIRNSIKIRSSMGAHSNAGSFYCCNLPPSSVENNNKYFHILPCDNNIFMDMVRTNKVKVLPMEFIETASFFESQLEECMQKIEHYESLLEASMDSQKPNPKLLQSSINLHSQLIFLIEIGKIN